MFQVSSAHLQEDRVVHMQHMVLSLSMRVPGDLSVHIRLTFNKITNFLTYNFSKEQNVLPEDDLRIKTCRSILNVLV